MIAVSLLMAIFIYTSLVFAETRIPESRILPSARNNSQFVSQVVPTVMLPGKKYKVSLTFKNTGIRPWTRPNYLLISQNPQLNNIWSVRTIRLPSTKPIKPGQSYTFVFEVKAPVKSGIYNFQWQMFNPPAGFFGQKSINLPIKVNSPPVISPIENKNSYEHKTLEFKVQAQDPDRNTLVYSASNLPTGANFNSSTQTFSWKPEHGQKGNYPNINFQVSDGLDSVSQTMGVDILKTVVFGMIYEKDLNNQNIPLEGVNIDVLKLDRSTIIASGVTDSTGHFDVFYETWADGTYFIRASKPGYKTYYGMATLRGNSMMPFSVVLTKTTIPQILSVNPVDGSRFYENDSILINATVNSDNSSPLEYQFSIDGVVKQAWSEIQNYTWSPIPTDKGIRNIKIEVRNASGQDTRQTEIYVLRKAIEPPV